MGLSLHSAWMIMSVRIVWRMAKKIKFQSFVVFVCPSVTFIAKCLLNETIWIWYSSFIPLTGTCRRPAGPRVLVVVDYGGDGEVNRRNCWLGSSQRHVLSGVRYLVSRTYRIWVVVWSVLLLSLPVVFVFPQTNILYMSLVFPPLSASASLQGTQKDCLNQCSQVTWPILTLISYMKFGEVWSGTSNAWIFCVYRVSIQSPCLSSVEQDINYEELVQSVLGSNKAAV